MVVQKFGEDDMKNHLNMSKIKRYIKRIKAIDRVPSAEILQTTKSSYQYPASITEINRIRIMDDNFQKKCLNDQLIMFHPAVGLNHNICYISRLS